jgi:threonine synthase
VITKSNKVIKEFELLGLIDPDAHVKLYASQATGCAPIVNTIKERSDIVKPVKPNTIAKSLAIGNPADGYYATKTALESSGWGESVSDEEIIDAMRLLAETEGVFTETAGGVTLAVAKQLIEQGVIPRDESIVVCITGNGLKTQEPLLSRLGKPVRIKPTLASFESTLGEQLAGLPAPSRARQAGAPTKRRV